MRLTALAVLLAVAGCSSAADKPADVTTPTPEADSGHDVIVPPTFDAAAKLDGGLDEGGAQSADSQHEADAAAIDSGSKVDADAGPSPDAPPPTDDAGSTANDAAPPRAEAGNDAVNSTDAAKADVDGGTDDRVCRVPNPKCDVPNLTDDYIRVTYWRSCVETSRNCGMIYFERDRINLLVPLICRAGVWRYGGVWVGDPVFGYFTEYSNSCDGHAPCSVGKCCAGDAATSSCR